MKIAILKPPIDQTLIHSTTLFSSGNIGVNVVCVRTYVVCARADVVATKLGIIRGDSLSSSWPVSHSLTDTHTQSVTL